MNFKTLVSKFENNELSFDELVEKVSSLSWAEKEVASDGSVDWVGENQSTDIDNFTLAGVFTSEQRKLIFKAIGS